MAIRPSAAVTVGSGGISPVGRELPSLGGDHTLVPFPPGQRPDNDGGARGYRMLASFGSVWNPPLLWARFVLRGPVESAKG